MYFTDSISGAAKSDVRACAPCVLLSRDQTCCEHWNWGMLTASAAAAARVLCLSLLPALLVPLREPVRVRLRMGDLPRLPSLCPEALSPALALPRLLSCLPALLPPAEEAAHTLSALIRLTHRSP
jgi:hypothetical protein